MHRPARAALLVCALAAMAGPTLSAQSARARLTVGAEVTRRCTVETGASLQVRCAKVRAGSVQTSADGRARRLTPLTSSGTGTSDATIPLTSAQKTTRVITVQF